MYYSILSDRRFRLFFSIWWIVWMIIVYNVLEDYGATSAQALNDSLISIITLAALCLLIASNMRFYLPRDEKYWYLLVVSLALSGIWLSLDKLFIWLTYKNDAYYNLFLSSESTRFPAACLMISVMGMYSLLWYGQREQKEMDARKSEAEQLAKDAELFKLRQQLQPHFLFNSLNSISALIISQPQKARDMIHQLSDFLRGTLKKDEKQWSQLNEELEYLQLYLEIEKVRFGYRLQTEVLCDDEALSLKLPSLLLQPVVENAIKFGLYDTTGEVMITIEAVKEDNNLKVSVRNPYDPETSQPLKGTGFGLASIQRRLFLLFARQDLITTEKINNSFITIIKIPQV